MLSRLVLALLSPLGLSVLLGGMALVFGTFLKKGARWAYLLGGGALLWLWLWSTPAASEYLRGWLESRAGPRLIADVSSAEYGVVLGGGMRGPRLPHRPDPDLEAAADRVWYAARLYREGKVKKLLLSGGTVGNGDGSEADAMKALLVELGVPESAMISENQSRSTAENASQVAVMLGQDVKQIVLVTSALHMPRARNLFEAAGFQVIPAACDFEIVEMPSSLFRYLPDTMALHGSYRAFKEIAGLWSGH